MRNRSPHCGERAFNLWRRLLHSQGIGVSDCRNDANDCKVYICASKDMNDLQQLLKPEVYICRVEELQAQEEFVINSVSTRMLALYTTGDGSCAIHALFGELVLGDCGYFELY